MKDLIELIKSLNTNFAEVLKELKDGKVTEAVEKITATVAIAKEVEEKAEAIETETEAKAEETAESEEIAKTVKDLELNDLIAKIKSGEIKKEEILKRVNVGISGDNAEQVIKDMKTFNDFIAKIGGVEKVATLMEAIPEMTTDLEKVMEKVNVSKQAKGGEDEEEEVKKTTTKYSSVRKLFNKNQNVEDDEDEE